MRVDKPTSVWERFLQEDAENGKLQDRMLAELRERMARYMASDGAGRLA